ncbi:hypothetical protein KKG90_08405, partial [Candidatus Bipolaricaulota bacterium]|nr:hypothetical protein [Candidatus Bipolaricaulota bacterium]
MRKLLVLIFLLSSLAVTGAGQGYVAQPADALVLPFGVEGTSYADVAPGVRGGTLHLAVIEDPGGWNHYASNETSTTAFTNRMFRSLLNLHPLTGEL